MTPTRPVLRYHGGKWRLADWIVSHFPPHRIYVEPFGGGGSVLMRKPRSYAEVYNDQWATVVNVFRVLRDPVTAARLVQLLELTPFSRDEFEQLQPTDDADPVERARYTILRSFAGFGSASVNGANGTGFRANSHRSHTTPAHDWRNYPGSVPAFVDRLRGVVIENRDALAMIPAHDAVDALFYVDPPYPHTTRNMQRGNAAYAVEMTDQQHADLAAVLHAARGLVLLSSYHCDLYDDLYKGWARVERKAHADGARDRVEVLWMNPACASCARQGALI
jgi:DNA adenine methylase